MKANTTILIVADEAHIGGASTVIEELARSFSSLGYNPIILEGKRAGTQIPDREKIGPVQYIRYTIKPGGGWKTQISYFIGLWKEINRICTAYKVTVVYTNFAFSAGICSLHPAVRQKSYFIFHGDEPRIMWTLIPPPRKYFVLGWIKRFLFSGPFYILTYIFQQIALFNSCRIITFSSYAKGYIRSTFRVPASNIAIVTPGIRNDVFKPVHNRSSLRLRLGLPVHAPVLLCTSRFEPRKGISLLLQSLPAVIRAFPGSVLVLASPLDDYYVNSGYFSEMLQIIITQKLSEHVRFLFNLHRDELIPYYQAADVYVLPSKELETFGLVTLEAAACGTPVVCFKQAGAPRETVRQISPSLIVERVNDNDLSKTVLRILRNPKALRQLSAASVRTARQYDWTKSARDIISFSDAH